MHPCRTCKVDAFKHLKPLLKKDGVLFGLTVLGKSGGEHGGEHGGKSGENNVNENVGRGWFAQKYFEFLNHMGVLSNREDTLVDLKSGLEKNFRYVSVVQMGSTGMFAATDGERVDVERVHQEVVGVV